MLSLNFEKKLHLKKKYNQGWKENVPDYPSTEYTRLYSTIVNMNWHKSDLAKRVINSSDAKEDWDSETYGRKLNTRNYTVTIYFITLL
jgi:hypothetical protein